MLPGLTNTQAIGPQSEEQKARDLGTASHQEVGRARRRYRSVLFFTSDDAAFITGQAIGVNDGQLYRLRKRRRINVSNDQQKIRVAREYFMKADRGNPNILEDFREDAGIKCENDGGVEHVNRIL